MLIEQHLGLTTITYGFTSFDVLQIYLFKNHQKQTYVIQGKDIIKITT